MEKLEKELGNKLLGVEIHLITPKELEWYKKFMDVWEEI